MQNKETQDHRNHWGGTINMRIAKKIVKLTQKSAMLAVFRAETISTE